MSNYVLPVSSLLEHQLDRPQQSSIQQILRLGYLQESNRTQWYYLEQKDKRCILLGAGCWTDSRKTGRCWHRPGGYAAFCDLALLGRSLS